MTSPSYPCGSKILSLPRSFACYWYCHIQEVNLSVQMGKSPSFAPGIFNLTNKALAYISASVAEILNNGLELVFSVVAARAVAPSLVGEELPWGRLPQSLPCDWRECRVHYLHLVPRPCSLRHIPFSDLEHGCHVKHDPQSSDTRHSSNISCNPMGSQQRDSLCFRPLLAIVWWLICVV
jgi:hypothetical protein